VIVAGLSYGQGSSREHAALCPMYLGTKAVIAKSIERIHAANLVNFGIVPLIFASEQDYDALENGAEVRIPGIRAALQRGDDQVLALVAGREIPLLMSLSKRQRRSSWLEDCSPSRCNKENENISAPGRREPLRQSQFFNVISQFLVSDVEAGDDTIGEYLFSCILRWNCGIGLGQGQAAHRWRIFPVLVIAEFCVDIPCEKHAVHLALGKR